MTAHAGGVHQLERDGVARYRPAAAVEGVYRVQGHISRVCSLSIAQAAALVVHAYWGDGAACKRSAVALESMRRAACVQLNLNVAPQGTLVAERCHSSTSSDVTARFVLRAVPCPCPPSYSASPDGQLLMNLSCEAACCVAVPHPGPPHPASPQSAGCSPATRQRHSHHVTFSLISCVLLS